MNEQQIQQKGLYTVIATTTVLMLLTICMSVVASYLTDCYGDTLPYSILMLFQGSVSLFTYGAAAFVGVYMVERQWCGSDFCWDINVPYIALAVMLMLVAEGIAEWAAFANWQILLLPKFEWLQKYDYTNVSQTVQILDTSTPLHAILATIVVAILPAICEEYFFRGVVQKGIYSITHNATVAILFSSIFFSIAHVDVYGFLPRIVYGITLGMLFWQSRCIVYPIIAHALNNAMVLLNCHTSSEPLEDILTATPANTGPIRPIVCVLIFVFLSEFMEVYMHMVALMRRFRRKK